MAGGIIAPVPMQKFWDNNGQPLANGKIFFYQSGTTTKQAAYTDNTLGTPISNPGICNARGELQVWFDPSKSYKVVCAPSTDNDPPTSPIWTVDNLNGALSPSGSIVPAVDNAFNLGSPTFAWAQLYLGAAHSPAFDTSTTGNIACYATTPAETTALIVPTSLSIECGSNWTRTSRYGNNLASAIAVAAASPFTIYIDGVCTLTANTTIPSTCTVYFMGGGSIATTASNFSITFNGSVFSPRTRALSITGSGTQTYAGVTRIFGDLGTMGSFSFTSQITTSADNIPLVKSKPANQTRTSTAAVAQDADLVFANMTGGYYEVSAFLYFGSVSNAANGGIAMGFSTTNGADLGISIGNGVVSGAVVASTQQNVSAGSAGSSVAIAAISFTGDVYQYKGFIDVTAGSQVYFAWAQNTSNGNGTILLKRSWMTMTKVS